MDNVTFGIMLLQIVVLLIALAVFVGCVIAIYLAKIYHRMKVSGTVLPPVMSAGRPVSAPASAAVPPVRKSEQGMGTVSDRDVIHTRDLNESIRAVLEKYGLDGITVATRDGLVVTGYGGDTQADAATYSHIYVTKGSTGEEGVRVFGIKRPGQELVGIIRAQQKIPESRSKEIEDDVKNVLDWWL
ncbi:MAG: hypothetical protein LUQ40_03235 [Methanomicrobiales archaeon]|nr:hypothetical protein [Methanomicrobiales archaeon]